MMPGQVCRSRGGAVWRRMHRLARTQMLGLVSLNLAAGGTNVYLPGLLWDLCSAPSCSEQVLPPQNLGCATGHCLGCALVVSHTTKSSETWPGNPLSSTAEIRQSCHREGGEYPGDCGFEASRSNPFRSRALFQAPSTPAWPLPAALPPLCRAHWAGSKDHNCCTAPTPAFCSFKGHFVAAPTLHTTHGFNAAKNAAFAGLEIGHSLQ